LLAIKGRAATQVFRPLWRRWADRVPIQMLEAMAVSIEAGHRQRINRAGAQLRPRL